MFVSCHYCCHMFITYTVVIYAQGVNSASRTKKNVTEARPQTTTQPASQPAYQPFADTSKSQPSSSQPANRASTPQVASRAYWYSSSSQTNFHAPRETWDSRPSSSQVLQLYLYNFCLTLPSINLTVIMIL